MEISSLNKHTNGPFPIEILLCIFTYLDGKTLIACKKTCSQWSNLITYYDDIIWPNACKLDFGKNNISRFWSLQFPKPTQLLSKTPTWQDMYRITLNWYKGYAKGFYPVENKDINLSKPSVVIGAPQEQGMFTTLTLSHDRRIIRSNPNYNSIQSNQPTQSLTLKTLLVQSPQTKQLSFFQVSNNIIDNLPMGFTETHAVVCHYTHPSSNYLVTGALNGTVAVWNLSTKSLVRMWQGHRGRVLCISMNDEVVVSGGSDNMIHVWDLDKSNSLNKNQSSDWTNYHRRTKRGMIDISSYLSGSSEWYQGVGEIVVNGHLIGCAPDASGPILIFSLLTGTLVYELHANKNEQHEWLTEDMTAFTRLCLTPFFLLTKGNISHARPGYGQMIPSHNVVQQRKELERNRKESKSLGYVTQLKDEPMPPASQMTPYQLYQYYQSHQPVETTQPDIPSSSACIHVWDLQAGKIIYRLLPILDDPHLHYTINDIRVSPDYSKVFASIEIRGSRQYEEKLFCWDFGLKHQEDSIQNFSVLEIDISDMSQRKMGRSWVCLM